MEIDSILGNSTISNAIITTYCETCLNNTSFAEMMDIGKSSKIWYIKARAAAELKGSQYYIFISNLIGLLSLEVSNSSDLPIKYTDLVLYGRSIIKESNLKISASDEKQTYNSIFYLYNFTNKIDLESLSRIFAKSCK